MPQRRALRSMPPNPERERKQRLHDHVQQQLQGRGKICKRCGATYGTYADICEADLGESCDGSREIAAAFAKAGERVGV